MVFKNLFGAFVLVIISLFAFFSCSTEKQGNVEMHPIESKIPHFDNQHLPIDTVNSSISLDNFPKQIKSFRELLADSVTFSVNKLNLLIGDSEPETKVIAIDENRLAVLDADNDKLFEYDLTTDTVSVIAESGRGPGDIMFTADMVKQGEDLYVLGKNMVISKFNTSSRPLEFSEVIPVDFRPISVGIAGDSMVILGAPEVKNTAGSKLSEGENLSRKVLYLLNNDGEVINRFGNSYDISRHWMLIRPLIANGTVRYSTEEDVFVQTFRRFPLIYVYDAQNLTLLKSYEVKDFNIGKQRYWPDEGRLRRVEDSNSTIGSIQIVDGKYLWIEIENRAGFDDTNKSLWQNRWNDYYVINLENNDSFYIGSHQIDENYPDQKYYFTGDKIFITSRGQLYSNENYSR